MLLPVEFFNCGPCCRFLQHRSCELVLIVDDDASLLDTNIDGVLAVIVPHAVSLATASHLFAPAWWHADLNINAFWSATAAWIVAGTRIIDPDDLGNGTRVHFPLVDILYALKQRFRCFVHINCTVQNVSTDCWPEYCAGYRRDRSQVGCNCRTSDANGKANACQLSESFHCLSFRLLFEWRVNLGSTNGETCVLPVTCLLKSVSQCGCEDCHSFWRRVLRLRQNRTIDPVRYSGKVVRLNRKRQQNQQSGKGALFWLFFGPVSFGLCSLDSWCDPASEALLWQSWSAC